MKVKQLHLQNYGRFEDLTINFAPTTNKTGNVTVIVGNNGAGKSQILQALATGFSWFVNELLDYGKESKIKSDEYTLLQSNEGEFIQQSQIKNGKNKSRIDFLVNDLEAKKFGISIDTTREKLMLPPVYGVKDSGFRDLIDHYALSLKENEKNSLPIIDYYSVDRNVVDVKIGSGYGFMHTQLSAFRKTLHTGIHYQKFFQWFRDNEDIENEQKIYKISVQQETSEVIKSEHKLHELLQEKQVIENIIEHVDTYKQANFHSELSELIIDIEEAKNTLSYHMSREHILREKILTEETSSLSCVRQAIEYFTDFKNPRIRRQDTATMVVEKIGKDGQPEELDVNQLSQGEKSLLALVGDIARRLAILNPSLKDPLQGEGVVMIDEVDLHLHPKWQHNLIDKLVRTFPNVQFILTTHSPHIISDNPDILVYALNDGELTQVPNVYGEDVNTVLTKVFAVPIRNSDIEDKFNDIRRAISNKNFIEAEAGIQQLSKQLPSANVELLKCRLMLAQAQLADKNQQENQQEER